MEDEILQEFLVESVEALDALDVELVELEQDPSSTSLLSSIFRRVHTIKGTCGFLGFGILESVSHVGENLLSKLRDGELTVTPPIATALLEMNDALREMLDIIEESGQEGVETYDALKVKLQALTDGQEPPAAEAAPAAPAEADVDVVVAEPQDVSQDVPEPEAVAQPEAFEEDEVEQPPVSEEPAVEAAPADPAPAAEAVHAAAEAPSGPVKISGVEIPPGVKVGDLLISAGKISKADLEHALSEQNTGDPRHVGEILVGSGKITPNDIIEALQTQQSAGGGAAKEASIRVDVGLLDNLMNLVGELVLARNQILQVNSTVLDQTLITTSQRLDLITTELQGAVMQTRMQPIENAWSKFPRVVRDLARSLGKKVDLEMVGKETELDKTLLEAIRDPLTHLVRNAIDHGIETPEQREAFGKSTTATLSLRSYHEGGQVIIEVADDGRGLNFERIREKVIEKDFATAERAARMSHRELIDMIFKPGFSTAEQISNVSGRGVGMDVVKTNIEKIGGSLDMQSVPGEGTTVKVKIPLTLAIIPALTITTGGERYAIPQVSLLELVRLGDQEAKSAIEWVTGAPVYRLRGRLLPLVFLNEKLDPDFGLEAWREDETATFNIVVLQSGDRQFGLVVDEINDTAEIVVKPLGNTLKNLDLFSGATIMGDGHVALILDVVGIAASAGLTGEDRNAEQRQDQHAAADRASDSQTLLVFSLVSDHRYAIPLAHVTRLEEFDRSIVERSGRHDVVQYRGGMLPLIHVEQILEPGAYRETSQEADEDGLLQVVVHTEGDTAIGVVVGRILDIVDQRVEVSRQLNIDGLLGSVVVQDAVTDVVDVTAIRAIAGIDA